MFSRELLWLLYERALWCRLGSGRAWGRIQVRPGRPATHPQWVFLTYWHTHPVTVVGLHDIPTDFWWWWWLAGIFPPWQNRNDDLVETGETMDPPTGKTGAHYLWPNLEQETPPFLLINSQKQPCKVGRATRLWHYLLCDPLLLLALENVTNSGR